MNLKKFGLIAMMLILSIVLVSAASAQATTPEPNPTTRQGLLRNLVQIVADDLNMQPADLMQTLRDQTLAEVIQANGGSVDTISAQIVSTITDRVNQAVTDGTINQKRADQIISNLPSMVQNALTNGRRGAGLGHGLGQRLAANLGTRPLIDAAMKATGLNGQQLVQALRSGSTLSEVITAHGGDPSAVEAEALATAKTRLDQAVTNGRLTADQESRMLDGLQALYDAVLSGSLRQGRTV
jgi:hypothetical protein